jgi:hypothetical protein
MRSAQFQAQFESGNDNADTEMTKTTLQNRSQINRNNKTKKKTNAIQLPASRTS